MEHWDCGERGTRQSLHDSCVCFFHPLFPPTSALIVLCKGGQVHGADENGGCKSGGTMTEGTDVSGCLQAEREKIRGTLRHTFTTSSQSHTHTQNKMRNEDDSRSDDDDDDDDDDDGDG